MSDDADGRYRSYTRDRAALADPVFRQFVDKRLAAAASNGLGDEWQKCVIAMRGYCRLMGYKLR